MIAAAGAQYLRSIGVTLVFAGFGYGISFALMGARRAGLPAMASLLRLAVVVVAGSLAVGAGVDWVFVAIAAGNVVFAGTLVVLGWNMRV
jgi:hypothetical protein